MNELLLGGIRTVLELIRDRHYQEAQQLLRQERDRFISADIQARRSGVDVLVKSIVQLNVQIQAITKQIELISGPGSRELSEVITDYLLELRSEKARLESLKRLTGRKK